MALINADADEIRSVWFGGSGPWAEPTNWQHTPSPPFAEFPNNNGARQYDAEVFGGNVVIGSGENVTIDNFTLGGGILDNAGVLTVLDHMTWTNGSLIGWGVLVASNGITFAGDWPKSSGFASLDVSGVSSLRSTNGIGGMLFTNRGALNLESDGRLFESSWAMFVNEGVLRKTNSTGTTVVDRIFISRGEIEVDEGTLKFMPAGASVAISNLITVRSNALVQFAEADTTFGNLTVRGGTVDVARSSVDVRGTVTVENAEMHLLPGTTMSGSGGRLVVTDGAALRVFPSAGTYPDAVSLNVQAVNLGVMDVRAGAKLIVNGSLINSNVLEVANGASVLSQSFGGGNATVENRGLMRFKGGSSLIELKDIAVNNFHHVVVESGSTLWRAGRHSGTFETAAGATLTFYGGLTECDGSFLLTGGGTNILLSGVRGPGIITNDAFLKIRYGPALGTVFHNTTNGVVHLFSDGDWFRGVVTNRGTLIADSVGTCEGALIVNEGLIEFRNGTVASGVVLNDSVIRKVGEASAGIFNFGGGTTNAFFNRGRVEIDGGVFAIRTDARSVGSYAIQSNAVLSLRSARHTFSNATFSGSGTALIEGAFTVLGTVTNVTRLSMEQNSVMDGPGVLEVAAGGVFEWRGGELGGTGPLHISSTASLMHIGENSSSWSARPIHNDGTAIFAPPRAGGTGGVIRNSGLLFLTNGWASPYLAAVEIQNESNGTVVCGEKLNSKVVLTNAGTLHLQSINAQRFVNTGLATLADLVADAAENHGTMEVRGTIDGNFSNYGSLEIGSEFGAVTMQGNIHFAPSSLLNVDIGGRNAGVDYDRVIVSGCWSNDGALNIRLKNGFAPVVGDRFRIVESQDGTCNYGYFTKIRGLEIGNGLRFVPQGHGTTLELLVLPVAQGPTQLSITAQPYLNGAFIVSGSESLAGLLMQTATNVAGPWVSVDWMGLNSPPFSMSNDAPQKFFRVIDPSGQQ